MKYRLVKLSEPGFILESDKLDPIITALLLVYLCETCVDYELPEDYDELNEWDQLQELMMTPCGAEFIFEEIGE
jgi:hypothetical protein